LRPIWKSLGKYFSRYDSVFVVDSPAELHPEFTVRMVTAADMADDDGEPDDERGRRVQHDIEEEEE